MTYVGNIYFQINYYHTGTYKVDEVNKEIQCTFKTRYTISTKKGILLSGKRNCNELKVFKILGDHTLQSSEEYIDSKWENGSFKYFTEGYKADFELSELPSFWENGWLHRYDDDRYMKECGAKIKDRNKH